MEEIIVCFFTLHRLAESKYWNQEYLIMVCRWYIFRPIYLSNAVEKYCNETSFLYTGEWKKWGPYGFEKDNRLRLEEYYPNALERTYKGVSGFIYSTENIIDSRFDVQIPDAVTSSLPVKVTSVEFVPDAYNAIIQAENEGLITVIRYEKMTNNRREWLAKTINDEYQNAMEHLDYKHFLQGNFSQFIK